MGNSVAQFFDRESAIFGVLPQFPPVTLKLKNILMKMVREDVIISANMKGYTQSKNTTRVELLRLMKLVSDSLLSYGANNGDPYIIDEDIYLPSALSTSSDSELYVLGVLLFRKADPVKVSLPLYGTQLADVAALNTTADSFLMQIGVPTANRKAKSRAVARLKGLFAEMNDVMDTLDDLMAVYEYTNPNLHSRYRSARNIQNLSGGKRVHKKKGRVLGGDTAHAPFTDKGLKGVKHFILYNESKQKGTKLAFYFSAQKNAQPQHENKLIRVVAGEKTTIAVDESGYSASTPYLNIYNPNASTDYWKAEVKKE
jgi:hypothetical protein